MSILPNRAHSAPEAGNASLERGRATPLSQEQRSVHAAAIAQTEAIFALEGMAPSPQDKAIDAAVLAGRVSPEQAREELLAHIAAHKTVHGFIESRSWALP